MIKTNKPILFSVLLVCGLAFVQVAKAQDSGNKLHKLLREASLNEAKADGWLYLTERPDVLILYSPKYISKLPNGNVRIWLREEVYRLYPDVITQIIGGLDAIEAKKFEQYSHSMISYECDCSQIKNRFTSQADYTRAGVVLRSVEIESAKWSSPVPQTIGETIWKTACKPQQVPSRKRK